MIFYCLLDHVSRSTEDMKVKLDRVEHEMETGELISEVKSIVVEFN